MIYKGYDVSNNTTWKDNNSENSVTSRFILFEVTNDKKHKFLFNRNILEAMGEQANREPGLLLEALELIKKQLDKEVNLSERLYYFEYFPGNFLQVMPPKWAINF